MGQDNLEGPLPVFVESPDSLLQRLRFFVTVARQEPGFFLRLKVIGNTLIGAIAIGYSFLHEIV